MSHLLHINTALETAYISIALEDKVIAERKSHNQKEHAAFLHAAIDEMLRENEITPSHLSGVSVISGPGSYTGLRVGMACAKGLCFALSIPLINVNTLEWMAAAAYDEKQDLICPMIDARRMEVFTAMYDLRKTCLLQPQALILTAESFSDWLEGKKILFFGNGAEKFRELMMHPNASFGTLTSGAKELAVIAWGKYVNSEFSDLAYAEPLYVKDFQGTTPS
jgi:tRNA threonylcarbamoyladenosine biosynthesis protein TsaB